MEGLGQKMQNWMNESYSGLSYRYTVLFAEHQLRFNGANCLIAALPRYHTDFALNQAMIRNESRYKATVGPGVDPKSNGDPAPKVWKEIARGRGGGREEKGSINTGEK